LGKIPLNQAPDSSIGLTAEKQQQFSTTDVLPSRAQFAETSHSQRQQCSPSSPISPVRNVWGRLSLSRWRCPLSLCLPPRRCCTLGWPWPWGTPCHLMCMCCTVAQKKEEQYDAQEGESNDHADFCLLVDHDFPNPKVLCSFGWLLVSSRLAVL
jgi:hypothetical protein